MTDRADQRDLHLTPEAARALDRAAIERCGIPGVVLMEHAAVGVAAVVRRICAERGLREVHVACGRGNNGGDGWAVARLLHEDLEARVLSLGPARSEDAAINERATRRLGIPVLEIGNSPTIDGLLPGLRDGVVVDALFGIGLDRPIEGPAAVLIRAVAESGLPVVSIDLPSGLDAATGMPLGPCIRATRTATMVAPKSGMTVPGAARWTGPVDRIDIGAPRRLLLEFGSMAGSSASGDTARDPSAF